MTQIRPDIATITSGDELRRWYWRRDELVAHARSLGLKTSSPKFELLDRIAHFLDTGETRLPGTQQRPAKSRFDWHKETLSRSTVLTDSYKSTQNVRRFFRRELGATFKFNIAFMHWLKTNPGKTLGDACEVFIELQKQQAQPGFRTTIKDHNQFNQYTRDFLAANPAMTMDDVRRIWSLKIAAPFETGRHRYHQDDLLLDRTN